MEQCYFCKQNMKEIDFKDTRLLKRYITGLGKIRPRKATKLCLFHQRRLSKAVKRARNFGLLSPTTKD